MAKLVLVIACVIMILIFIVIRSFSVKKKDAFNTDLYIPYKQIPNDYKIISIFPDETNGIFDWNSISVCKTLYYNSCLTNGIIRNYNGKIEIEDEHIYNGCEYSDLVFSYLSKEYMDSAIILAQCVLKEREKRKDNIVLSSYVNPCAFLCRHAIELKIKQCLCNQNRFKKSHKLNDLWKEIEKSELDKIVVNQLDMFIKELSLIDSNGESIRYGTGQDLLPINDKTDYDCIALVNNTMFLFNQLHKISF